MSWIVVYLFLPGAYALGLLIGFVSGFPLGRAWPARAKGGDAYDLSDLDDKL